MPRSNAEREHLLERVETALLQGIERPTALAKVVPGLTRQTAAQYAKIIEKRWATREGVDDREKLRRRLIKQAQHVMRRAWESYVIAFNSNSHNGASSALRRVLDAQERIAKLSGLDTEHVEHSVDEATLERWRAAAITASEAEIANDADPIRTMRGLE